MPPDSQERKREGNQSREQEMEKGLAVQWDRERCWDLTSLIQITTTQTREAGKREREKGLPYRRKKSRGVDLILFLHNAAEPSLFSKLMILWWWWWVLLLQLSIIIVDDDVWRLKFVMMRWWMNELKEESFESKFKNLTKSSPTLLKSGIKYHSCRSQMIMRGESLYCHGMREDARDDRRLTMMFKHKWKFTIDKDSLFERGQFDLVCWDYYYCILLM